MKPIFKFIKPLLVTFCISIILSGCDLLKKPDFSKTVEPNAKKRARENAQSGKGIQLFGGANKGNGNFLFASANPMWKASLDTLNFVPLSNVDYSGGIIITDWYSEKNFDEAIKISIRFLSNEIRADGLLISLHKRTCQNNKCTVRELKSDLVFDIRDKILKKAAIYKREQNSRDKKNRPKKAYPPE